MPFFVKSHLHLYMELQKHDTFQGDAFSAAGFAKIQLV